MNLLDPKNADMADLLTLIRDISGQLEDILDGIAGLGGATDEVLTEVRKPAHKGKSKPAGKGKSKHAYRQGVLDAVEAVLSDLVDRASLIPVSDSDDEYNEECTCCLLRKNGYPTLARLSSKAAS